MNTVDASKIGRILYNSLKNAQTIPPLTETISNISIDDAYDYTAKVIAENMYAFLEITSIFVSPGLSVIIYLQKFIEQEN